MPVSKEVAEWAVRLLLGYDKVDDDVIELHRNGYDTVEALRDNFMRTHEARRLFIQANADGPEPFASKTYLIPPFLLRPPEFASVATRFEPPTLDAPVSQLCTYEQMQTETYGRLCRSLGLDAAVQHRKTWEFAFILAALEARGVLAPGRRGLGFGTGREMLPSLFAAAGVEVVATDAPADLDFSVNWAMGSQWAEGLNDLWRPDLVDQETFLRQVTFRPADMNNIPSELIDFDFCWSACAFEHLGSIRMGLDYLHNSLKPLKPGGVSVQTTEFNLSSNDRTIDQPGLCLFRKQDFEMVIDELTRAGHTVEPLNLWPGVTAVDEHIDLPPYSLPHLKIELQGYLTTSIGVIITKGAD